MIGLGNTRRSWSVSCQRKSGTQAWGQLLADAILDRLMHNAHRLSLKENR